jgi:hypothetical protein
VKRGLNAEIGPKDIFEITSKVKGVGGDGSKQIWMGQDNRYHCPNVKEGLKRFQNKIKRLALLSRP